MNRIPNIFNNFDKINYSKIPQKFTREKDFGCPKFWVIYNLLKSEFLLEFFKMINVKVEFWVAPNTQCSFKVKIIFDSESSESI